MYSVIFQNLLVYKNIFFTPAKSQVFFLTSFFPTARWLKVHAKVAAERVRRKMASEWLQNQAVREPEMTVMQTSGFLSHGSDRQ